MTDEVVVDDVVDVADEVVDQPKSRLDHLSDVLDARLNDDDDAAQSAFHSYVTMTTKNILSPEVDDGDVSDGEIDDMQDISISDVGEEGDAPEGDNDDLNTDDINIDDHIPAE